eukprot:s132_g1.t1
MGNGICIAEERALVAKRGSSTCVLAMRLTRRLDAKGRPFTMTVARCTETLSGLLSAMQNPNVASNKFCRTTLKNTGDMELAKLAHQQRQVYHAAPAGQGFQAAPRRNQQWNQQAPAQAAPAPKAMPAAAAAFPIPAVFPPAPAASAPAPAAAASSASAAPAAAPAAALAEPDPYWAAWEEDDEDDD